MHLEVISKEPKHQHYQTPLLFIHGAWHGAWCWEENFLPYFTDKGYVVHALSLRGHGNSEGRERLRWSRSKDYVADVHQVVSQLPTPPIIVAHSMGGYVTQKYLEQYKVPAAVLLAPVPVSGVLRTSLNIARKYPRHFLRLNLKMSLYPIVETEALTKAQLFSADMPPEQVKRCSEQIQDESYLAFLDMLVFNLPKPKKINTPMLILGGEDDAIFTIKEFQKTASAYDADFETIPHMAHDMMLEQNWRSVADRVASWLERHALKS